jgi:hypothetical protein
MSGGQGRKESHRYGDELHCGFGDQRAGQEVNDSETFSLFSTPKQSMLLNGLTITSNEYGVRCSVVARKGRNSRYGQ